MLTEIERGIFGAILLEPEKVADVEHFVTADDFHDTALVEGFKAAQELIAARKPADATLIAAEVQKATQLDYTQTYIECMQAAPRIDNLPEYCKRMRADSVKEKLLGKMQEISDAALVLQDSDIVAQLREILDNTKLLPDDELQTPDQALEEFGEFYSIVQKDHNYGLCRSGMNSLDDVIGGGFRNGQLYVVGARPGMGKTTFALSIATKVAEMGRRVLFVSLEMSTKQITAKRISSMARIPYQQIISGTVPDEAFPRMSEALDEIATLPITVTDKSSRTVRDIATLARREEFDIVIIDYIGLIQIPEDQQKKSKYEQMCDVSRELKLISKNCDKPVIALCQLNREAAKNRIDGKTQPPTIDQLRDSGSIEQDADDVWLLHRPEYYTAQNDGLKQDGTLPEDFEVHIGKSRYGRPGQVATLRWFGSFGRIEDAVEVTS